MYSLTYCVVGSGRGIFWRNGEGEFIRSFSRLCARDFVTQIVPGISGAMAVVSIFAHLLGSGRGILSCIG